MTNKNRAFDSAMHRSALWAEALDMQHHHPVISRVGCQSPGQLNDLKSPVSSGVI